MAYVKYRGLFFRMNRFLLILALFLSIGLSRKTVVKLATLAPEGTEWHGMLIEMGQEWKKKSKKSVHLRVYPGGVIGDERDMVRKMRIGQIHAAAITTEGLSEIVPDFSAYYVPLAFQNSEDVMSVTEALLPSLEKQLDEQGFKLLHIGELGWAYWFTSKPIKTPDDLKSMKIFTWAGDFKWERLWEKAGYNPVPLASVDILSGLQTGLINSFSTIPLYALSQQSFGIAKHMLDLKWGVLMAGIVIDNRVWGRISKKYHDDLISVTKSIQNRQKKLNANAEKESIKAMQEYGLQVHSIDENGLGIWKDEVKKMEEELRGNIIPAEIYDKVIELTQ
ncbi:MAG: C4-dicarboxylate ABC transporter [Candidatus Neomarinimicrobiota bacterium]|nr:MAG: C4-dicarboxylate ABC transporter [Candidatus Neomarinimicrobiota bacterium]